MVGRALLARLLASGWDVLATARSRTAASEASEAGATPLYTDIENLGSWSDEAGRADVLFHLAAPTITPPVHGPRTRRNARLARRGAEALAEISQERPVVTLSSALVYGSYDTPIADEAEVAPLALARAAAATEKTLSATRQRVLRTGWIYGHRGLMGFVVPALRMRRYRIVGTGDNLWPLLSADDAAGALVRIADAEPGTYQASEHAERPPTQNEVIAALCAGSLRKPDRVPGLIARGTLGGPLADALSSSQWLPSERLRALGWAPERSWSEELAALTS